MKSKCPCCKCYTLVAGAKGNYEICPVCFWENDSYQFEDPNSQGGANKVSLNQAKDNYKKYGACQTSMLKYVRKPTMEEMMERELIGACGIFCRACDHYFANTPEGIHLLEEERISERVKAHPCKGCKAEKEEEICAHCVNCDVRKCSISRGVSFCGECKDYPCNKLDWFANGLDHHKEAHTELEKNSQLKVEDWYALLSKRWKCPNCEKQYSYYETVCSNCNSPLDGFSPDYRKL